MVAAPVTWFAVSAMHQSAPDCIRTVIVDLDRKCLTIAREGDCGPGRYQDLGREGRSLSECGAGYQECKDKEEFSHIITVPRKSPRRFNRRLSSVSSRQQPTRLNV